MSKELADRIVALGVLKRWHDGAYSIESDDGRIVGDAAKIVREGRVVLALMEKLSAVEVWRIFEREGIKRNNKPIDRIAIATACCEVLEQ